MPYLSPTGSFSLIRDDLPTLVFGVCAFTLAIMTFGRLGEGCRAGTEGGIPIAEAVS